MIVTYQRPLLFAIVGGINTGVDFAVFHLLYFFTPLGVVLCQAAGYTTGVICSFLLNRGLTFRDGVRTAIARQAWRFVLVNLVSLLVSMLGIHLLSLLGLPAPVAKVLITAVTMVMNYFGYKWFVFQVKGR